ncbi:MAG: nuclear transport factor 2 family protein [Acidimicrobiales bacterium]|nr:nuclear transport factor 2 family protein [Acidimicrobiales bacterium]
MDIQEVSDRIAVEDLLTRYATAVDRRDWARYRSVFTHDAEIDYTSAGGISGNLEEVIEFLSKSLPLFEMTQHSITNIDLEVVGDSATVSAVFNNPLRLIDGETWFTGGWYHHDLVRTTDGWLSRRLREESAWFDRAPF